MQHPEYQYLKLLIDVLYNGSEKEDRTGIGTKSTWWQSMSFNLSDGFPLFTTRFISFRIPFEEMMFFLRGETDTKKLEDKDINIWHGNTTREFLDKRGLHDLPEGDMGKGYGFQIRNFGGTKDANGFDQLKYLVDNIKNHPSDRRHMMSYWHPFQMLHEAALPCCHYSYVCQVINGNLNAGFTMRSSDIYHGLPTNIAAYAFLTHLLAKLTNLVPGTLSYLGADCHLYKTQFQVVEEQIKRIPKKFPQFKFLKDFTTLDEALEINYEDIEISGYEHCGKLQKINMAI